jgi:hypothetical protein
MAAIQYLGENREIVEAGRRNALLVRAFDGEINRTG